MMERELFVAALHLRDSVRASFLAHACGLDESLRERVESMLIEHDRLGNFLQSSSVVTDDATASFDPNVTASHTPQNHEGAILPRLEQGALIAGKYKLLEPIGEGGMGEVWVADQLEPIRRRVALKLIKPGMDSRNVLGRFDAERQALAMMDHPNIAKVLDAGTTADGRPYFVMELVKGTPITEFCDIRKLTPKQRLELFVPVCQAIQHAHMKGIIHRDIKPSNVLVELYDDRAVAKVIDFGVAKAIGQQLTEKTIYTGFGTLVGTPAYMAPEQATFNALDVDTRADVYALGVLLYELLAGSPPIEKERLKLAALDEVLRIVRDEEPPRPSQRLSTSQAKASIAATRQSDPAKLSALMKGEIDWIVMKAIEKDRTRRYDSANGLAKDILRHLNGDAVEACPPTLGYRLQKVYRRNRAAVLVVAAFGLVLMFATGFCAWQATLASIAEGNERFHRQRAEHNADLANAESRDAVVAKKRAEEEERRAKASAEESKQVMAFFQYTVLFAGQPTGEFALPNVTIRQAIEGSEPLISTSLRDQPLAEATVRLMTGSLFMLWGRSKEATHQFRRAIAIRHSKLGPLHTDTLDAEYQAGYAYASAGHVAEAIRLFKPLVTSCETAFGAENFATIRAVQALAQAYEADERPIEALTLRRHVVEWSRQYRKWNLSSALRDYGRSLLRAGHHEEAERTLRDSLTELGDKARHSPAWVETTILLGTALLERKQYALAELEFRSALIPLSASGDWSRLPPNLRLFAVEAVDAMIRLETEVKNLPSAMTWRAKRPRETAPLPRPAK